MPGTYGFTLAWRVRGYTIALDSGITVLPTAGPTTAPTTAPTTPPPAPSATAAPPVVRPAPGAAPSVHGARNPGLRSNTGVEAAEAGPSRGALVGTGALLLLAAAGLVVCRRTRD